MSFPWVDFGRLLIYFILGLSLKDNGKKNYVAISLRSNAILTRLISERTFYRWFLTSFSSFGYAVSEKKIFFRNISIRNRNYLWWPYLLRDWDEISNLYRGPSIDDFNQVSVHLPKQFQRRRNWLIRNKNCLWRPCLLTDRGEMSNLYRGLSIDASYQVLFHLAKWFQEKIFRNIPIRNKN